MKRGQAYLARRGCLPASADEGPPGKSLCMLGNYSRACESWLECATADHAAALPELSYLRNCSWIVFPSILAMLTSSQIDECIRKLTRLNVPKVAWLPHIKKNRP